MSVVVGGSPRMAQMHDSVLSRERGWGISFPKIFTRKMLSICSGNILDVVILHQPYQARSRTVENTSMSLGSDNLVSMAWTIKTLSWLLHHTTLNWTETSFINLSVDNFNCAHTLTLKVTLCEQCCTVSTSTQYTEIESVHYHYYPSLACRMYNVQINAPSNMNQAAKTSRNKQ